jgi:hypothetical protein
MRRRTDGGRRKVKGRRAAGRDDRVATKPDDDGAGPETEPETEPGAEPGGSSADATQSQSQSKAKSGTRAAAGADASPDLTTLASLPIFQPIGDSASGPDSSNGQRAAPAMWPGKVAPEAAPVVGDAPETTTPPHPRALIVAKRPDLDHETGPLRHDQRGVR